MTIWLTKRTKAALALIFLLVFLPMTAMTQAGEQPIAFAREPLSIQTQGKTYAFTVELAESPQQQQRGLMFREKMSKNSGMLFIKKQDMPIVMWMKDTPLSLDMLFIDNRGQIVYIAEQTTPGSTGRITAGKPVRAVLELIGGAAKEKHIHVGDHIISGHFKP